MSKQEHIPLPDYVVFDPETDRAAPMVLRSVATKLALPLSTEDLQDMSLLTHKFDAAKNSAGLAAPQIGVSKSIIIFAVLYTPELKKWRPDLTDTMPKTIWLNPDYKGLAEFGYSKDYEGCFSVNSYAGQVIRYKTIYYEAYTPTGHLTSGTVSGYLARVIQHEIDHVNGILFIDKIKDKSQLITKEVYKRMRQEKESRP